MTKTDTEVPFILKVKVKTFMAETSLVVQWLRFHTSNAGGPGLIRG